VIVYIKRTTFCRKTGKVIQSEIIDKQEMDEDEYFAPLVSVLSADQKFQELCKGA